MKYLLGLLLFLSSAISYAQTPVFGTWGSTIVSTAPSGPCSPGSSARIVATTGIIYTCQSGTWTAATSQGVPAVITGQANGFIPLATGATAITAQSHLDDGISNIGMITSSEPLITSALNLTVNVATQTGANLGAKLASACAASGSTGIMDATGFVGAQTWASTDISTACAGKQIIFSAGQTITVSGSLGTVSAGILLGSNTTIDCRGAKLFMIGGAGQFDRLIGTVAGASNIEIKNCEMDGNKTNNTNVAVQNHAVMLNSVSNVSLHNNYIHSFNGDGIMLWGAANAPSSNVRVYNDYHADNQRTGGVSFINGKQSQVVVNWFDTTVGFEQVHAENDSSSGEFANDIVVDSNILTSPSGTVSGVSCSAQVGEGLNVSRWVIANNRVISGRINIQRCPYSTLDNNTLISSSYERPINVASHHIIITNNTITALDPSVTPSNQAAGIRVDNSSANDGSGEAAGIGFNIIENNTIEGVANRGIVLFNTSYNQVKNNPIRNIQQVSGSAIAIIQQQTISSLTTDNQIGGNAITDTQVSPTTQYGVYWDGAGNAPIVSSLNDITNMVTASTFGTLLGLGTAATHASTDFAPALILTTTGSGAASYSSPTLNIPTPSTGGAALSFQGWCTGTVGTANATAYNIAPDNAGLLCNATTQGAEMVMTANCTAQNLYVVSHTAGSAAGSGLITILRAPATNGTPSFSATALTCTMGTNTQCSDTSHTVSFSAGDRWRMTITTGQATDTTANVGAVFVCQ